MLVIEFANDEDRTAAYLLLVEVFGLDAAQSHGRWRRLAVAEPMLESLTPSLFRYRVVGAEEFQREADELASGSRLYDLHERNYPNQRGDSFRSLQVFECWVCNGVTNRVVMGGSPGYGVRAPCPNGSECWHHEIEEKIKWSHRPHPASIKRELEEEIAALRARYAEDVKNDVAGLPDFEQKRSVTNTMRYRPGSKCEHWLR